MKHGVVQDKLLLPGLLKLKRLLDSGFFGRVLSVRGEFGYWVFEGDWQEAQRPSWNYRSEDGGGIVMDSGTTVSRCSGSVSCATSSTTSRSRTTSTPARAVSRSPKPP